MDLQDHAAFEPPLLESAVQPDHGQLDDVSRAALNRHVDRLSLSSAAYGGVGSAPSQELREIAPPMQQGLDVALLGRFPLRLLHVDLDLGIIGEVALDEAVGLLLGEARALGQAVAAHAITQSKVDHLGHAPHLPRDLIEGHLEDGGRRAGVDVLPPAEGGQQPLVPGDVGQDAQLHLGVVCCQEPPALLGDEGAADATPLLGADRDVLEVRVAGTEPPRDRPRLVVRGVHPPRLRVDQRGQGVRVGGLQLAQVAVLQDELDDRMLPPQLLQHAGRGGVVARFGPGDPFRRQP